jgi:hypothetical protein
VLVVHEQDSCWLQQEVINHEPRRGYDGRGTRAETHD